MKKHIAYTLASVMAISPVVAPVYSVVAQTQPIQQTKQKLVIKTAQDFIQAFHMVQKVNSKKVVYYELIKKVDETNYLKVLAGKRVFDTLTPALQKEISFVILRDCKKDYLVFVQEAVNKDLEIKKLQEEQSKEESKPEVEQPKEDIKDESSKEEGTQKPVQPDTKPGDSNEVDGSNPDIDSGKDETKPDIDSDKEESNKGENTDKDEVDSDTEQDKEGSDLEDSKEETEDEKLEIINPIETPDVIDSSKPLETIMPKIEPVQPVLEQPEIEPVMETKVEEVTVQEVKPILENVVVPTKKEKTTAQGFIDEYLTSDSGNIYSIANTLNYKDILSAMGPWTKLSAEQKAAVNTILESEIGKTFNKLLQEAQSIELGNGAVQAPNKKGVHTATESNAGLFGALSGLSLAFLGFLSKKYKEQ